jgi:tRNA U34 5-methylaminomethyl-2-thiouridine-forming methyltransferase MnmC
MAVMKDKRHYLSACTINDEYIYAFGGFFGSTEQEINDTIEMYEVEKNTWSVLTVRMKVSNKELTIEEPTLGMERACCVADRDHPDRQQKYQSQR